MVGSGSFLAKRHVGFTTTRETSVFSHLSTFMLLIRFGYSRVCGIRFKLHLVKV